MSKAHHGPGGTRTYKNHSVIFLKMYPPKNRSHLLVLIRNWFDTPGWSTSCIALAKMAARISKSVNTAWEANSTGRLLCYSRKGRVRALHRQARSTPTFRRNTGWGLAASYCVPSSSGPFWWVIKIWLPSKAFYTSWQKSLLFIIFKKNIRGSEMMLERNMSF